MESREQTHEQPRRALGDGNLLIRIEARDRSKALPKLKPTYVQVSHRYAAAQVGRPSEQFPPGRRSGWKEYLKLA
jgi:hypothetical protein